MHGYGWDGMGFGMVGMLLFWILLIAAIIVLIKYTRSSGDSSERQQEKSALDILKERYARGEIGREEFEQKKHDLSD
jgi:Predicted membrane protein